jgi:FKBP-type peptidyl-prolyl cis-trans isomerase FklB
VKRMGRRTAGIASLVVGLAFGAAAEDAAKGPPEKPDPIGYSAGYEFGRALADLERRAGGVDLEAVLRGVLDAFRGAESALGEAERKAAADGVASDDVHARSRAVRTPARAGLRGNADDFAQLNARREGVVTLPSGVQVEVLEAGRGRRPEPTDVVAVRYEASLADGSVFDSTEPDGPIPLRLDEIAVPGLREALLTMNEGARCRVVIPPKMGFGASGRKILRNRDLIYEIELVSVEAPR